MAKLDRKFRLVQVSHSFNRAVAQSYNPNYNLLDSRQAAVVLVFVGIKTDSTTKPSCKRTAFFTVHLRNVASYPLLIDKVAVT
jgi:hypothetical protein